MNANNLELLNSFRAGDNLAPLAAWRGARHQPILDSYMAAAEAANPPPLVIDSLTKAGEEIFDKIVAEAKSDPNAHTKAVLAKIKDDKAKPLSYKHLARKAPAKSVVGTPVEFVHQFLALNPMLSRKEAIAALVDEGVNFSTARTQYQKWFTTRKAAS